MWLFATSTCRLLAAVPGVIVHGRALLLEKHRFDVYYCLRSFFNADGGSLFCECVCFRRRCAPSTNAKETGWHVNSLVPLTLPSSTRSRVHHRGNIFESCTYRSAQRMGGVMCGRACECFPNEDPRFSVRVRLQIRPLPFFNLTENLTVEFLSDSPILPTDFDVGNFQPSPQILMEKSKILTEIAPPEKGSRAEVQINI